VADVDQALLNVDLTLVESLEEAWHFLRWLSERRPILAIDTETKGLDWWEPHYGRLAQFGDGQRAWAVPIREWWQVVHDAMRIVVDSGQPVAMHNAKYDMHILEVEGFPIPDWSNVHDTMIMDHICYPIRSHALKRMAVRKWGPWAGAGDSLLKDAWKETGTDWATVPIDEPRYWGYGCMDVVLTARMAEDLGREMATRGLLPAYERESRVSALAYGQESEGLRIDLPYTERLLEQWEIRQVELRLELDAWGLQNPSSNKQLGSILQAKEDWDPWEFTETGDPKVTKSILSKLEGSEIVPRVLEYKRMVKWCEVYLRHFIENSVNGVVHPNIRTLQARTGRMSITNPPMQTLPSGKAGAPIRTCILPPEGRELYAIDYDAMELRVMAHYSQDAGLLEVFRQGLDPHSYVASVVYNLPYEEVVAGRHAVQRGTAKNTQFARIYGAGAAKIAETAGVPEHQIEEFLRIYNVRFPGVDQFMKQVERQAKHRLLHEGEPYMWSIGNRYLNVEPDGLYKLVNYLIQGGCADILKMKLIELDKVGLAEYVMLPVHDELLFGFDPEWGAEAARVAATTMEEHELFAVPLTCGPEGPFPSWGAKYA
jgi:DNA polymerase-1